MKVKVATFDAVAVMAFFGAGVAAGVAGERIRASRPDDQNCSSYGELVISLPGDEADAERGLTPAAELIIILTTDTQGELWR